MPTIITVHGTNATGVEQGSNWWQITSDFERDVHELVSAEDGSKVEFKPFIWNGANSETGRRKAGAELLREIRLLEASETNYCLVGHSHGGSVISHALLDCASSNSDLPHLSKWISVATPFIQTQNNRRLFSRLGLLGKAIFLGALSLHFGILGFYLSIFLYSDFEGIRFLFDTYGSLVAYMVPISLLPFGIFYACSRAFIRRKDARYNLSILQRASQAFQSRHLALYHGDDEAVDGLRMMSRLHLGLFDRRLVVDQISLIAVVAVISSLFAFGAWHAETWHAPVLWVGLKVASLVELFADALKKHGLLLPLLIVTTLFQAAVNLTWVLLLTLGVMFAVRPGAVAVSSLLAKRLDNLTSAQVRQSAFGNDTPGEIAICSCETPSWSTKRFAPLPDEISRLLANKANEAAAQSVEKFRAAIGKVALSFSEKESPRELVSKYVSWNELIHNIYFKTPLFRKLVCCAIAQSTGFTPSEKLKNSPEYKMLVVWLQEVEAPPACSQGTELTD